MPLLLHLTLASASLSDSIDHIVEQKATLAQRIGYGMAIINGGGLRTASGSSHIDIKALRDSAADASIAEKEKVKWTDIFAARET